MHHWNSNKDEKTAYYISRDKQFLRLSGLPPGQVSSMYLFPAIFVTYLLPPQALKF